MKKPLAIFKSLRIKKNNNYSVAPLSPGPQSAFNLKYGISQVRLLYGNFNIRNCERPCRPRPHILHPVFPEIYIHTVPRHFLVWSLQLQSQHPLAIQQLQQIIKDRGFPATLGQISHQNRCECIVPCVWKPMQGQALWRYTGSVPIFIISPFRTQCYIGREILLYLIMKSSGTWNHFQRGACEDLADFSNKRLQ